MSEAKFEVEKFDEWNDFGLWTIKMKALLKKVTEYHGGNGKGLVARGKSSEKGSRGKSESRDRKSICWNCNEEGHLKRDCSRRRGKQGELSGNAVVEEERYKERDILTSIGEENAGEVQIKLHTSSEMLLEDARHVSGLKKNLISPGTLDKLGYKYKCQGGVVRILKGALTVMKGLLQKGLYVLRGMASTTVIKWSTPDEKYLESLEDGGDLLGTYKVEKHLEIPDR
ncbi:hypothetical protein CRG98_028728 [Punica granatum]|uniref:CCHC-type domain-containing protein n=1 Tax=Punica granatum TaxID=22663 RepID=A0A2I0J4R1_PUNGR|nr:hypothetical protein CRG98_028728 [Punica granatum]